MAAEVVIGITAELLAMALGAAGDIIGAIAYGIVAFVSGGAI